MSALTSPLRSTLQAPSYAPLAPRPKTSQARPNHSYGVYPNLRTSPQVAPHMPWAAGLRRPQPCRAEGRGDMPRGGFSHQLFMETIGYHKRINMHPAIEALRGDKVASARIYGRMLVDKLAFHEAIEHLIAQHRDEALLAPFADPVLPRSQRLRHDLHALVQKPHVTLCMPAPASQAAQVYVEALHAIAKHDPRGLAAHAWLHYLGDMHGGQLMQGRLNEAHGDDTTTSFSFAQPVAELRSTYGRALDMPLTAYEEKLLREHAVHTYEHSLLMHDLWANP